MIRDRAQLIPSAMAEVALRSTSIMDVVDATLADYPDGHPVHAYASSIRAAVKDSDPSHLGAVIGSYVAHETWERALLLGSHPAGYVGTPGFPVFGPLFMNLLFFHLIRDEQLSQTEV